MHLGIPATVAAPLGVLDRSALGAAEDPHRFTVAAGLAMGSGGMKAVNLIPQDAAPARSGERRPAGSAYVVLGVLAVAALMAVGYVFTSQQRDQRQSDAAAAKRRGRQLEAQAAQQDAYTDFSQIKAHADSLSVAHRRGHPLRLGALHARAVPRHAGGQLDPDDRRLGDRGRRPASDSRAHLDRGPRRSAAGARPRTSWAARPTSRTRRAMMVRCGSSTA